LLDRFIQLADSAPYEVLSFVHRWGVLDLCEHLVPISSTHVLFGESLRTGPLRLPEFEAPKKTRLRPFPELPCFYRVLAEVPLRERRTAHHQGSLDFVWEPISAWRHYARQARSILDLAAALHQGETTRPEDWLTVYPEGNWLLAPNLTSRAATKRDWSLGVQRQLLAGAINAWLEWGRVHPEWRWLESRGTISFGGAGLFGALAVGLMLAVNEQRRLSFCTACGKGFSPDRARVLGLRAFCDSCKGKSLHIAYASRDLRERKARVRALYAEGKSVPEIEAAIKCRTGTVARWLVPLQQRRRRRRD
jgi:hypothetical protein